MAESIPLFSVYLSQAGSRVTTLLDQAEADKLWRAVYVEGLPCGVWTQNDAASRSTGLIVVPRRGGLVLNMEPAVSIPARPDNATPLTDAELAYMQQAQQPIPGWIKPENQPRGRVVFPDWAAEERDAHAALGALADSYALPDGQGHQVEAPPHVEPAPHQTAPQPHQAAPPPQRTPPPPGPGNNGVELPPRNDEGMREYQRLQGEARELGITPLTQSADALAAHIAAAREALDNAAPPA